MGSQKATQFSLFLEDEKKMDNVAFLVDITSHLSELNLKLQGKDNSICELMTAVRSFQRKLEVFKEDLQGDCAHFPAVQEQVQGQRNVSSFVDFVDKLIVNFSKRFDSFSFGRQLTMFIQNPFLITDVREFSKEVTQHFKWANAGPLQMQLVDLQADVALKEQFGRTDPATFWLKTLPRNLTLDLKVFDVTKTEVDEEVFEFLIQKQDLGVLEICLPQDPNGGPKADRGPFTEANCLTTESLCCEAIALMKHSADEAIVKEKMKQTFTYRQKMLHDPVKSSEIFTAFPRFLDIPGMIEQDFNLMFGDVTSAKFLEKWPTVYKKKVLDQSRGLTQTGDLQDLVQNAGSTTEVENGWDSDMSSMMVLVHLLPPSTQGRKRPRKLSARQASEHLVKFLKVRLGPAFRGIWTASWKAVNPICLLWGPRGV
ncbi:General transcription factor II-I repeat domain containing protein 2 [Dissostichus eleginoides]|uniref:General transcription factor II-I repeat domain containing protein 2 n=1 Tax=Dissostichus eleginoides TaxID=100907 RepID=A0AAD9FEV4_DISEL|nr:General transcription factor II-I repeat domain containing protein 2 [Dissostichus eleginoides]